MRSAPFDRNRLKALREQLGISQQELATRLGVSVASVSRWESGRKAPIKPYVEKIEALERSAERRRQRGESTAA